MISICYIKSWLDTLHPLTRVYIDEGGLTLRADEDVDAYLEVGGKSVDENDEQEAAPC